ncbi:MAG TPA: pentapeptide repeat-containing protein [Myxococcales bacterium]|jgi:uncharacterized protein YjbI with pentapeptide repeats
MWGVDVARCSFRRADLRESAFGGVSEAGRRSRYAQSDFSFADFRDTAHQSAVMEDCLFVDTKLQSVNFAGTEFIRCKFVGAMENVSFAATDVHRISRNEMRDVDLSAATLKWVDFRKINMASVKWPTDERHLVVHNYRHVLAATAKHFESHRESDAAPLARWLKKQLEKAGDDQQVGVINLDGIKWLSPRFAEEFRLLATKLSASS